MTTFGPSARSSPSVRAAVDVGVALAVTALDLAGAGMEATNPVQGNPSLHLPHVPIGAYGLVALAGLSLLLRRRRPLLAWALACGFTLAYTIAGYNDGAPLLAVSFALYAVAAYRDLRSALFTLGISVVALFVANGLFGPFGWTGGFALALPWELAVGVVAGRAIANRRAYIGAVLERAQRAEVEREQETRRRVDAERLRIARELHDVVAHSMATISVQAGVAAHFVHDQPDTAATAIAAIRSTSSEALRELRSILHLLRQVDQVDSTTPVARLDQLPDLVAATTQAGVLTEVVVVGQVRAVPPAVDLAAYRIVQESLTNVLRHVGPTRATVTLRFEPTCLRVECSNEPAGGRMLVGSAPSATGTEDRARLVDGGAAPSGIGLARAGGAQRPPGPDPGPAEASVPPGSGNGIRGMRERTSAIGGTLEVGPRPDGGYLVRALLPYPEGEELT